MQHESDNLLIPVGSLLNTKRVIGLWMSVILFLAMMK